MLTEDRLNSILKSSEIKTQESIDQLTKDLNDHIDTLAICKDYSLKNENGQRKINYLIIISICALLLKIKYN